MIRASLASILTAVLLTGCPRNPSRQPETKAAVDAGSPGRVEQGAGRPAPKGYEACARVEMPPAGRIEAITMGGVRLVPEGPVLRPAGQESKKASKRLVLGVLGGTHHADAANLEQLARLRVRFHEAGVHAIVVLGGLDDSYQGIRDLLKILHGGVPLVALPGNLESRSGFSGAAQNLGSGVVDMTIVRAVVHPAGTLVGVPGYHLLHHLKAGEQGCSYDSHDLAEVAELAKKLPEPRVLLSHGPPRGQGIRALDRAFGGINAGDPDLTRLLREGGLRFSLSSHIHESAGRAQTLEGRPLSPEARSGSLLLNVGSADAVPHQDLAGQISRGTAAVVTLEAGMASYRIIELAGSPSGKPAEKNGNN